MGDNIPTIGTLNGSLTSQFKTCFDAVRELPEYRNKWIVKSEWVKIVNERCKDSLKGKKFVNKNLQNLENLHISDDSSSSDDEWFLGQNECQDKNTLDIKDFNSLDQCLNEQLSTTSLRNSILGRQNKRRRTEDRLVPMVYVVLQSHRKDRKDQKRTIAIKALLDSGASGSIVSKDAVKKLKINKRTSKDSTEWTTAAGTLTTLAKCQVNFLLPELSPTKTIHHKFHVTENRITNYDMVIGRDLLQELGIDL